MSLSIDKFWFDSKGYGLLFSENEFYDFVGQEGPLFSYCGNASEAEAVARNTIIVDTYSKAEMMQSISFSVYDFDGSSAVVGPLSPMDAQVANLNKFEGGLEPRLLGIAKDSLIYFETDNATRLLQQAIATGGHLVIVDCLDVIEAFLKRMGPHSIRFFEKDIENNYATVVLQILENENE